VDGPDTFWPEHGFVEMTPAIHLPTTADRRDEIAVWLYLPAGAQIVTGDSLLRYPPGSIADRVERRAVGEGGALRVVDVRGTRFGGDGTEMFRLLRPSRDDPTRLLGMEWRRDDVDEQMAADAWLTATLSGTALSRETERLLALNQCAACHVHDKPQLSRGSQQRQLPRRATDGAGLYVIRSVLEDSAPLEFHRPVDVNADDPFVAVHCDGSPARVVSQSSSRRFVCAGDLVPIGRRDVAAGVRAADLYTLKVCASRRYLFEHLDPKGRRLFAVAFAACGIAAEQAPEY